MDGLILKRSEFLVLLDAVKAPGVIGLSAADLFPPDPAQSRALVQEGVQKLKARGLLHQIDDVQVLKADLAAMATAIAYPSLAVITTRELPSIGQQVFLHYLVRGLVVEQSFPDEGAHRLATLANWVALIERLLTILPAPQTTTASIFASVPQATLEAVRAELDAKDVEAARQKLTAIGLAAREAQQFVAALNNPVGGGSVALLKRQKGKITDMRTGTLVHGAKTTWWIAPATSGSSTLLVQTIDRAMLEMQLRAWMDELA